MTVRELIKILKSWPHKDTEVIISCDSEGRDFTDMSQVVEAAVNQQGYVVDPPNEGEEPMPGTKPILVIYPV